MGFPFDFTFRIDATRTLRTPESQDCFLRGVAAQLQRRHARNIRLNGSRVDFKGPSMFFTFGFNMLKGVSGGRVEICPNETAVTVEYRLSFAWMAWMGLVMLTLLATLIAISRDWRALIEVPYLVLIWSLVAGVNAAFALVPFRSLLRRELAANRN